MKKVKLSLNQLKVDSFETSKTFLSKGTVKGNYETQIECSVTRDCSPSIYHTQGICCPATLNFEQCESKVMCQ